MSVGRQQKRLNPSETLSTVAELALGLAYSFGLVFLLAGGAVQFVRILFVRSQ